MEKLSKYLKESNLTATQLAVLSGVSMPTIYGIINGRPVYKKTAKKISDATHGKLKMEDFTIRKPPIVIN